MSYSITNFYYNVISKLDEIVNATTIVEDDDENTQQTKRIDLTSTEEIQINMKKKSTFEHQMEQSITDKHHNINKTPLYYFLYSEGLVLIFVTTIILLLTLLFNEYVEVLCFNNIDYEQYKCKSYKQQAIQIIRIMVYYTLGHAIFMESCISENFDYKYKSILKFAFISLCVGLRLLRYFFLITTTQWIYCLWGFFGFAMMIVYFQQKISSCLIFKRIVFVIGFFLFNNIYHSLIKQNDFLFGQITLIIVGLTFVAIQKNICCRLFNVKLEENINQYEDVRIMINYSFIMDQSLVFREILTNDLNGLSFVFFNFVVMIVYHTTQFHLYLWMSRTFFYGLYYLIFGTNRPKLEKILYVIFSELWINYSNFKISVSKSQDENIKKLKNAIPQSEINEFQIKRVVASQYLLISLQTMIYFLLIVIFERYVPFNWMYGIIDIDQNQIDKYLNNKLDTNRFQFTLTKFLLAYGLFIGVLILSLSYTSAKDIKLFAMKSINKKHFVQQILTQLFAIFILYDYTFDVRYQPKLPVN